MEGVPDITELAVSEDRLMSLDQRMFSPNSSRASSMLGIDDDDEEAEAENDVPVFGAEPVVMKQTKLSLGRQITPPKRKRTSYTHEEDQLLLEAYAKYGPQWSKIVTETGMARTAQSISKRYAKIKPAETPTAPRTPSTPHIVQPVTPSPQQDEQLKKRMKVVEEMERAVQQKIELVSRQETSILEAANAEKMQVLKYANKAKHALLSQLVAGSKIFNQEARRDLALACLRLGSIKWERQGNRIMEVWSQGSVYSELKAREQALSIDKERISKEKKELTSIKRKKSTTQIDPHQLAEVEGVLRLQQAEVKKREVEISQEYQALERQLQLHRKEMKRVKDEDESRFNNSPVFQQRYVLLHLLGKGGFSEVYKAYDLDQLEHVAIKIHQLADNWQPAKKESYQRHALRELEIQKRVQHPRIVQLFDSFQIDANSWATVMSYCEGSDLDFHLKQYSTMSEKEAMVVIRQVLGALHYLHTLPNPIIHYDLKPANILFNNFNVKLTDFGLSKVMDDSGASQMELTSQGAGTYWYLPPECFNTGPDVQIGPKVDVWSVGVIFFQVLYGKKPFGDSKTQAAVVRESLISLHSTVQFPEQPKVSPECQRFIRSCLSPIQASRPTVAQLLADPYLATFKKPKNKSK